MQLQRSFGITPKSPLQNYDALHDKFAAFYFNGYGVKKHLKKLRKAIESEPYKKGNKQYTQTIAKKLTQIDAQQKKLQEKIKPYQQSLKPSSLQKLKQMQTFMHQNKKKKLQIETQDDTNNRLNRHMMSSLPKIEHSNRINSRNTQLPSQTTSSLQKVKEKDLKSISIADKSTINKTQHKFQVYKNRSNQSLQTRKIIKMKTQEPIIYKEVKHEDFVNFLKKRQEDLLQKSSKSKELINEHVLEEFQ